MHNYKAAYLQPTQLQKYYLKINNCRINCLFLKKDVFFVYGFLMQHKFISFLYRNFYFGFNYLTFSLFLLYCFLSSLILFANLGQTAFVAFGSTSLANVAPV